MPITTFRLRIIFAVITIVMAANSFAQPYIMTYDSLSESDNLIIPTSVNELVFFETDTQSSTGILYVDTILSIGFPFSYFGVPFDSVKTLNRLSGIAFGSTPFSDFPHIATLGQFTKPSGIGESNVGFYRTDTSIVFFYENLNYLTLCQNINESNSFSASIEITSFNHIITTIYNPIIVGCNDYVAGRGFLEFGVIPVGPITSVNLLNDPNGSITECGLTKFTEHNSSIELVCNESYAGWLYGIEQSFRITYTNLVSSLATENKLTNVSWSIVDGLMSVNASGHPRIPFDVFRITGEKVSIQNNKFNTINEQSGLYIIRAVFEGAPYTWKVYVQ